jgi:transcriptional regulator with XRE-family HTH domain
MYNLYNARGYFNVSHPMETNVYNVIMKNMDKSPVKETPDFGRRMADARRRAGLTQVELAKMLGVNQQAITAWERQNVALRAEQLRSLAEALNTSSDYLIGISNGMKETKASSSGKVGRLFEQVSNLPRRQREKVVEFVEAFIQYKIAAG